ncbi:ras guanine nucleotide exchange factor domain-containing protein [Flagelloscypha sp. PMI_526]|nr:ras guanine nucleotide exchange factor domain-containing protein [Flagelloscypha sp. PMI_526]
MVGDTSAGPASQPASSTSDALPLESRLPDIERHRTTQRPPPRQLPSRLRSGSLGSAHHGHSRIELPPNMSLTVVVVGGPGCGKSTVIHKGAKGFKLGDPSHITLDSPIPGTNGSSSYTRRVGQTHIESLPTALALNIIEAQAPIADLDSLNSMPDSWPSNLPPADGVIVCYDVSSRDSFNPVEPLLRGYRSLKLPTVVLACKTDLGWEIDPELAYQATQTYHNGMIDVTTADEAGKDKMRKAFDWILKAALRHRRTHGLLADADYQNPASPDVLRSSYPWSEGTTPTASPSISSLNLQPGASRRTSQVLSPASPRPPGPPQSPTRTRSTGDLLMESERARSKSVGQESVFTTNLSNGSSHSLRKTSAIRSPNSAADPSPPTNGIDANTSLDDPSFPRDKESKPAHWATLDELLDKLLFLAISGDDPAFISNFLLTYRRFTTPRAILLAMQKRMRQLDSSSGDPMFACYAQMKICHLLETWIQNYANDFAVRGTHGALNALIKSILSKTYLLHYGSDFLPFLERMVDLQDKDSSWSVLPDDVSDASDEYSDDDEPHKLEALTAAVPSASPVPPPVPRKSSSSTSTHASAPAAPLRERKSSVPTRTPLSGGQIDSVETVSKTQLAALRSISTDLLNIDSGEIAQEITRIEVEAFLAIEPRHWLKFTFTSGKKDPRQDTLVAFNEISNRLGDWVTSLILCHDRPKQRARQVEKLVEIAQKLRSLSNYSALRAFLAGIHGGTTEDTNILQNRSPEMAKNLQSWRVLLHPARAHRAYRLALRNTKGACIPALEVHMADLIKANEGNDDVDPQDPTKIHWGKFNMMGRFISSTTICQAQCRASLENEYKFPQRDHIRVLLNTPYLMNDKAQSARLSQLDSDWDDTAVAGGQGGTIGQSGPPVGQGALFKKLFSIGR